MRGRGRGIIQNNNSLNTNNDSSLVLNSTRGRGRGIVTPVTQQELPKPIQWQKVDGQEQDEQVNMQFSISFHFGLFIMSVMLLILFFCVCVVV